MAAQCVMSADCLRQGCSKADFPAEERRLCAHLRAVRETEHGPTASLNQTDRTTSLFRFRHAEDDVNFSTFCEAVLVCLCGNVLVRVHREVESVTAGRNHYYCSGCFLYLD